jgi:hypothetical protein
VIAGSRPSQSCLRDLRTPIRAPNPLIPALSDPTPAGTIAQLSRVVNLRAGLGLHPRSTIARNLAEPVVRHYGLFADLIADMQQQDGGNRALRPLFQSAEAYLRMWERTYGQRLNRSR